MFSPLDAWALLALGILMLILGIFMLPLKTIRLIGFQGTGSEHEEFIDDEPLIYAGHVALSYDAGSTFYGFTPHAPQLSNRDVIIALKDHSTFPGVTGDDTAVFLLARVRFQQGYTRTPVYEWRQRVSLWRWFWIRWRVRRAVRRSPLRMRYGFPDPEQECYNCAVWPATVGVRIPEESGNLRYYATILRHYASKEEVEYGDQSSSSISRHRGHCPLCH